MTTSRFNKPKMVRILDGDITQMVSAGQIAHCVNCQDVMGSGVAKALYTKWPAVKLQFHHDNTLVGFNRLGNANPIEINTDLTVWNCYGQEYYGREPGRVYADINAIRKALTHVLDMYFTTDEKVLNIPYKMACGLAGLNWDLDMMPLLEELASEFEIEIVCWRI